MKWHTHKLVILSLLLAISVGLYAFEALYIPPLPIPGAKLGLTNIVTIVLLFLYGWRESMLNVLLRTVLGSMVTGTFLTPAFVYSLAGATASGIAMAVVFELWLGPLSFFGISLVGAVVHNMAQLAVATFVLAHWAVWLQAPYLILLGVTSGAINGLTTNLLAARLPAGRTEMPAPVPLEAN